MSQFEGGVVLEQFDGGSPKGRSRMSSISDPTSDSRPVRSDRMCPPKFSICRQQTLSKRQAANEGRVAAVYIYLFGSLLLFSLDRL